MMLPHRINIFQIKLELVSCKLSHLKSSTVCIPLFWLTISGLLPLWGTKFDQRMYLCACLLWSNPNCLCKGIWIRTHNQVPRSWMKRLSGVSYSMHAPCMNAKLRNMMKMVNQLPKICMPIWFPSYSFFLIYLCR